MKPINLTARLTALLLTVLLCLSLLPASVLAVTLRDRDTASPASGSSAEIILSGKCGDNVSFTLTDDGVLTISGTGPMADYKDRETVPAWCVFCSDIQRVVIESGVTHAGNYAFYNASMLASVSLPDTLESIGNATFARCIALEEMVLPTSVTSIGYSAFSASGLKQMELPDTVTEIGRFLFRACKDLESVRLSNSLSCIRYAMFEECTSLKSIEIPDSVKAIGNRAFYGCTQLETVVFPEHPVKVYNYSFALCPKLPPAPTIAKQPAFSLTQIGEDGKFSVEAAGQKLTYTWYYRNPGDFHFTQTSKHGLTYKIKMTEPRNGRAMYCEVVDCYGRSKKTNIAVMGNDEKMNRYIYIFQQPKDVQVNKAGDLATIRIKVTGTGRYFNYHWFYKNPNMESFQKCSFHSLTKPYYSIRVTKPRNGRQMYCVVYDADSRKVTSNIVTFTYKNASPGAVPEDEE